MILPDDLEQLIQLANEINKNAASLARFIIAAPIGAFKNHIRWLMMADTKYEHIVSNVYPKDRTAFNWLEYEWKFRTAPEIFGVYHYPPKIIEDLPNIEKIGFFFMSPQECLKHYLKLNPTLNGSSIDDFLKDIQNNIDLQEIVQRQNPNIPMIRINVQVLQNRILDREFYNTLITFFGIKDNYDIASRVHELWYDLNKNAEQSMLSLPEKVEDFPWTSETVFPKLTNQKDYDKLLELMREIYQ